MHLLLPRYFVFVQFLAGMALQLQIQALCPRPEKFN
jgi:hypothetical protein